MEAAGNEAVLGPLFGFPLTTDETVCLQSLCRADICNLQKIGDALRLLRGGDHAVAPKTCGWLTTIDNVLCVLLYRDPHAFLRRFVGEYPIHVCSASANK